MNYPSRGAVPGPARDRRRTRDHLPEGKGETLCAVYGENGFSADLHAARCHQAAITRRPLSRHHKAMGAVGFPVTRRSLRAQSRFAKSRDRLLLMVIRTMRNPWKSRPSTPLLTTVIGSVHEVANYAHIPMLWFQNVFGIHIVLWNRELGHVIQEVIQ